MLKPLKDVDIVWLLPAYMWEQLRKDNFVRFDALVPDNVFTLDRDSPEALAGLAAGQSRFLSPLLTGRFAEHLASPHTPNSLPGDDDKPGTPTTPGGAS